MRWATDVTSKAEEKQLKMAPSGLKQNTARGSFVGFLCFLFLFVPRLQGNNLSYCFQQHCKRDDYRRQVEHHRNKATAFLLSIKSKENAEKASLETDRTVTLINIILGVPVKWGWAASAEHSASRIQLSLYTL